MNFINPPTESPENIIHKTFYSQILNHEIGYNIYLPSCYNDSDEDYSILFHLHGWQGNESSEIFPMEKIYKSKKAIAVFVNVISGEEEYLDALLQFECVLINELIPFIDSHYKTNKKRENRAISGFSMGGNMAFYYAVKHSELFGAVTAYAGTYHHLYHKGSQTVGAAPKKAVELYEEMMNEKRYLEKNNILSLLYQNAENIRGKLSINIHVGTADILFCDNEILHLYLESLDISHEYMIFEGVSHELEKII